MALPNSQTSREMARLGSDFASIDISNSHITHSKSMSESQLPDKKEKSSLLPMQIENNSHDNGTITWYNCTTESAFANSKQFPIHHS